MINEIKEALEKINSKSSDYGSIQERVRAAILEQKNRYEWYAYLLDELEKANKALDAKFIFWSNGQDEDSYAKQEKMIQLEQEHTAMKEALEWYASDRNWGSIEEYGAWVSDGGELARTAISALTKPCID